MAGYDPAAADRAAAFATLVRDRRFWRTIAVLSRFFLGAAWRELTARPRKGGRAGTGARAARIRRLLTDLGPTYVKLGQFVSARRDLLPAEAADELALLQDSLPPVDPPLVGSVIKAELGREAGELFASFEPEPLASASIGQVHRARLADGRPVVVKVQRPGLRRMILQDLGCLRLCAKLGGRMGRGDPGRWLALLDEFGRTLMGETDYLEEGRNADRLRRVLRHYPQARIPRVFWRLTGRRVITMEYIPGTKIDDLPALSAAGVNLRALAQRLIDCYLEQVVCGGFYHGDPHPGNLAVDGSGNLIIYDFGVVGRLSEFERQALAGAVEAVCRRDAGELSACLFRLGVLTDADYREPAARALAPLIAYYGGQDVLSVDFSQIEADVDALIAGRALAMPPALAYLLRTGSSLEGVARTLRPNFSFARAARPFLTRWAIERGILGLTSALEAAFK